MIDIALAAGREIMMIYGNGFTHRQKADLTPVTEADEAAELLITRHLQENWPATPVIAEEAAAAGRLPDIGQDFFLVDPLDGTKEFISRNGEFTVNIAFVSGGATRAGVVYAPARNSLYAGERGLGAGVAKIIEGEAWHLQQIAVRPPPALGLTALASRSHADPQTGAFLARLPIAQHVSAGSSLKFCLIAAGQADIYPRFGRTMEWDTAAGHAVLAAAGGTVMDMLGHELRYGKQDQGFENPPFLAASAAITTSLTLS